MSETITLGPFFLFSPIGKGGMGEVWRGAHAGDGTPVAVKVVTAEKARSHQYLVAFRSEVHAVAKLRHPGIVTVFDYGVVSGDAEDRSEGRLVAGGPYLAMELVEGGSPFARDDAYSWGELRSLLLALLEALAHAHARGLVHRDLKPGNVLVSRKGEVKLADFGLAHALFEQTRTLSDRITMGSTEPAMGTPHYMAPEQFDGRWRDYGPWTDLYSLGCMAYELATGRLPFQERQFLKLAMAHMLQAPPELKTIHPFPPGFERWVMRLLEKAPQRRFRWAADAAHRLAQIDTVCTDDRVVSTRLDPRSLILSDASTLPIQASPRALARRAAAEPDSFPITLAPPPLPPTWRRPQPETAAQMAGAGLGLYGLRAIPLVDREAERGAMWRAFEQVHRDGGARALVLRGPAGIGKTRLMAWLSHRVNEAGAATVVWATHSPTPGPADGLSRMAARHFRCVGLAPQQTLERTEALLRAEGVSDPYEWEALSELMAPATEATRTAGERVVRLEGAAERYALLQRLLQILGRDRPVLACLDDVQWGSDASDFARHLLTTDAMSPTPALVLMTVRDEALAERPLESSSLEALLTLDRATEIALPRLSDQDHMALVRGLLGLDAVLGAQVEQRTRGNPLFAVQLVGDWVRRGVLVPGEQGFVLSSRERADLPDHIHQVWAARIDRLLQETAAREPRPDGSKQAEAALELAAALGQDVIRAEWRAACEKAGAQLPDDLDEALITSRLARADEERSWSFVHGMLRESLVRRARYGGRWAAYNRASAEALRDLYPGGTRGLAERIGGHLVEGKELEEALAPLLEAAQERYDWNEFRHASALLDQRDQVLRDLWLPEDDVRCAESWLLRAHVEFFLRSAEAALDWVDRAEQAADQHGWPRRWAEARRRRGNILKRLGRDEEAARCFHQARHKSRAIEDRLGEAHAAHGLGFVELFRGAVESADRCAREAIALYDAVGDALGMGGSLSLAGCTAMMRGDLEAASTCLDHALEIGERIGHRHLTSDVLNNQGDLARYRGDLFAAEALYERAENLQAGLGRDIGHVVALNRGFLALASGRFTRARQLFDKLLGDFTRLGRVNQVGVIHCALLACVAHAQQWEIWDRHFAPAREFVNQSTYFAIDIGYGAQLAGELALRRGEPNRARQALGLARQQWAGMGRSADVAEVDAKLASLDGPAR